MKGMFVEQIRAGEPVKGTFAIKRKELLSFRNKEGEYLSLVLTDRTGEVMARVWEGGREAAAAIADAAFARVSGQAVVYAGKIQLNLTEVAAVNENEVTGDDFLPVTPQDRQALLAEILAAVESIAEPYLKTLLMSFFDEPGWLQQFTCAPAGKLNHQPYIGGLLEHVTNMVRLVPALAQVYPRVDRDLLLAGVILHDIGKIQEYSCDRRIYFTDAGRLLGHIVLGIEMISERIRGIAGFPDELRLKILHMIASHHGEYEWQSPKRPKFVEACLLHHLDLMDSEVYKFAAAEAEATGSWCWSRNLGRHVYVGARGSGADAGNGAGSFGEPA